MDRSNWRYGLLVATFLLQLGLLVSMIAGAEQTIGEGSSWKFRTAPVDPVDLFRGRYARLSFPMQSVPIVEGEIAEGDVVYALIENDDEGFARFSGVSASPPDSPDYLELVAIGRSRSRVRIQLPYDRFYMDEERAPEVDRRVGRRNVPAWAVVRVHEGRGVVVDLHIEDDLDPDEFSVSSLRMWPADTEAPISLVQIIRETTGDWQLAECQRKGDCVLAAVDLDDSVEDEFLLTMSQPLGLGRMFYVWRIGEPDSPQEWQILPMQYRQGRLPHTPEEVLEALEASGARGEAAPRRWLRLGEVLLYVPG